MNRREERVAYELHASVLEKMAVDPGVVHEIAMRNLAKMKSIPWADIADGWLKEWRRLLNGSLEELREFALRDTELGRDLRQCSPFAGVLTQGERLAATARAVG